MNDRDKAELVEVFQVVLDAMLRDFRKEMAETCATIIDETLKTLAEIMNANTQETLNFYRNRERERIELKSKPIHEQIKVKPK